MRIETDRPFLGIEDRLLVWTAAERKALMRAAEILERARELVGPDSDLGTDLGKGEVVCRAYGDPVSIVVESSITEIQASDIFGT